jgi:hypothetical protein
VRSRPSTSLFTLLLAQMKESGQKDESRSGILEPGRINERKPPPVRGGESKGMQPGTIHRGFPLKMTSGMLKSTLVISHFSVRSLVSP